MLSQLVHKNSDCVMTIWLTYLHNSGTFEIHKLPYHIINEMNLIPKFSQASSFMPEATPYSIASAKSPTTETLSEWSLFVFEVTFNF